MESWIISANGRVYNHEMAFQKNGYIDWKQTRKYELGDIIYIYCTKPISAIQYKTVVTAVNQPLLCITDDSSFWVKGSGNYCEHDRFVRLTLTGYVVSYELKFDNLRNHGLRYAPQSPTRVKKELYEYLEEQFNGDKKYE